MKHLVMATVLQLLMVQAAAAEQRYSQTYVIYIRGIPSGTELVTEETDGQGNLVSSSESEIFLSDGIETKRLAFVTRTVLSRETLVPISYSYRYTSGESKDGYEVVVKDGQAHRTLFRGGHVTESAATLAPDVTILDFNVYHQYDYIVRRYDAKKGGKQSFRNYMPLIGGEIPLSLTRLQDTKLEHSSGALPVANYKIEYSGIWSGTCSADKEGRLVRLVVREQDLEVVRKDLVPEPAPETPAKAEPAAQQPQVSPLFR